MNDLKYGLRLLRQAPGFTAVAIAALGLGIGANTAIFSTVDSVVVRPLPYQNPDRLVYVHEDASFIGFPQNTPSPGNFVSWKERNQVFTDMAAIRGLASNLTVDGPPEHVTGSAVTANFFSVLGVGPMLGRVFTEDEDRTGAPVVVIGYGLWRRRYQGDPRAIGKTMLMDGLPNTIIGVMGRSFVFRSRDDEFYVPMHFTPSQLGNFGSHYLRVIARLKPGVSVTAAQEEMSAIAARLARERPNDDARIGAVVELVKEFVLGNTRTALWVLMAAAGGVLLIACANLASLLLVRAAGRKREMAVRAALGAGRARLIRQMVIEGVVLSLAGGVLGLAIAPAGMKALAALVPDGLPGSAQPALDARVLIFALTISLATGILFSLAPAIGAAGVSLHDALKQGGRTEAGGQGSTVRDALVVIEVASALVLLVGAGLMIQTLARLRAIDVGFRPDHLITMQTDLPQTKYKEGTARDGFYSRVLEGVRTVPGVEQAAYTSLLPFESIGYTHGFRVEGSRIEPGEINDALLRVGTPDYLQTLGVKLDAGRFFRDSDGPDSAPVILINETLAKHFWPNGGALGHRLWVSANSPRWWTIVGVVADVHERGYALEMKAGMYLNSQQWHDPGWPRTLVARTRTDPGSLAGAIRAVIAKVDPEEPVSKVRTMDAIISDSIADRARQMTLLGVFAGLALLLASTGLYGVLSYVVAQRSREIGVRMALGAKASNVIGMVVGRGMALAGAGLATGLAVAWMATRAFANLLYGVATNDMWTYASVAGLLAVIALAACAVPARRAAMVDPLAVLREE